MLDYLFQILSTQDTDDNKSSPRYDKWNILIIIGAGIFTLGIALLAFN